jgi:uncharacterized protein (TIGR03437 family)
MPVVFSANNSADYSTTLAQGSLFVIFGYDLGPPNLVQISSFPLPNLLADTSVTVQSGSTTLNCPMVYTSSYQVAAILPSNTPVGLATITVQYGSPSSPGLSTAQVAVASSSTGIFTTNSLGMGPGSFTALNGALITYDHPAQPGQYVTAWATGLGPISGPDNDLPSSYPNFPNVNIWVGGQPATILYAGRSGCCAAIDQITFTVPQVAGCNVPVTIAVGNTASNTVSLPIGAAGGACTDSGPTIPTAILNNALNGQQVRAAAIGIGPGSLGYGSGTAESLARRLSAALHVRVAVSDASALMRAYAAGNLKAVRAALSKYASQWKALDARARRRVIAQLGETQEGVAAVFGSFSSEAAGAAIGSGLLPSVGSCLVIPPNQPSGLRTITNGLDAGTSLYLTGSAGSLMLKQTQTGQYSALLGSAITGPNVPAGTYTITGFGGRDVGPFTATIKIGTSLEISNKPTLATVDRTQPVTITWTGGTPGSYVLIGGYSPNMRTGELFLPNASFVCAEDAGKDTFTIPTYILSSMNATAGGKGILGIAHHPLSNQITIPDIDLAYFVDGSSDTVRITFK